MNKWVECSNLRQGIKCTHSEDSDYNLICPLSECNYEENNYKELMKKAEIDTNRCK